MASWIGLKRESNMKALIIKQGAMGDVLRTTPILYPLRKMGYEVTWLTSKESLPLVPRKFCEPITIEDWDREYDLALSLDEDIETANYADIKSDIVIGVVPFLGKLEYTWTSREWYDMSLISKLPKKKADELKYNNTSSYQEILFRMLNLKFNGEEYILNDDMLAGKPHHIIGIEQRAGGRWPMKAWNGYGELAEKIGVGYKFKFFKQKKTLKQYARDIGFCDVVVAGDTLAMHLAIAQRIRTVAIFTCTSPSEIYDYNGLVRKVVSPKLKKAFYKTSYIREAANAIPVDEVFRNVLEQIL